MTKLPVVVLSALLASPLTAFLGRSMASGNQGDDSLTAFTFENYPRAFQLAKSAAQEGDFMAQFVLARIYEDGKGAQQDKAAAEKLFRKVLSQARPLAENGEPRSQWILGRMYAQGWAMPKDYAQAFIWYRKAAEQGNEFAQSGLAYMYSAGVGIPKDEKAAIGWYRKAAEQGYAVAQYNLARMYLLGEGSGKDEKQAAAWFRKGSDQGYASAMAALGTLYASGLGVSKDENEAVALYRRAAELNHAGGQFNLGGMYLEGTGVTKDEKEGFSWILRAAEQGKAYAQVKIGFLYQNGIGVPKDEKEAVAWYRKAADQEFSDAQNRLGLMYLKGLGVSKSEKRAFDWFRKAAEQEHSFGQANLGMMYVNGLGVSKDDGEAIYWLRKGAMQGSADAQTNLGYMYQVGRGVVKDDLEAAAWYRKASAQGDPVARNNLKNLENASGGQTNPAAASVSKEDIRDIIQSALKPTEAPASKGVSSDVDNPSYSTPENPDNFAVVIGVEKYASLPPADFAERDAESMRAHLMAMGYPARNIFFLSGQQATRAKIAQSVNTWLPGRVTPTSTVFFYYSGHGAPDPQTSQAYLVPTDGDPEDLDSTAYPIKLLYEKLGKLKSKQVIVALDSCFSGAGGRSVLAKGTRPLVGKIDMGGLPDSVVALTASAKSQISGTIEEQGHGAFTYYMLKGLEGAANNGAGRVTVQSLHDYLTPKVRDAARLNNREQTPQLLNVKLAGASLR